MNNILLKRDWLHKTALKRTASHDFLYRTDSRQNCYGMFSPGLSVRWVIPIRRVRFLNTNETLGTAHHTEEQVPLTQWPTLEPKWLRIANSKKCKL
eukprot:194874-Amphidinium_carterae.1